MALALAYVYPFCFPRRQNGKLSNTKFYILSEFLIRCMSTLADRGVDLET